MNRANTPRRTGPTRRIEPFKPFFFNSRKDAKACLPQAGAKKSPRNPAGQAPYPLVKGELHPLDTQQLN